VSKHRFSATCCGEPLKNPILPIVYLLIPPARYLYPHKPKRNKARAETVPIYRHINTNTFIYMSVLFCVHLELCLYLLSLIILYFSYTGGLYFVSRQVSCALQGVTLTGRYTINGRHSRKNLPEMGELLPNTGVKHDDRKREAVHQVWCNQTKQRVQAKTFPRTKQSGVA
jgi:hypothetical protein